MPETEFKDFIYLGDGVYAKSDGFHIWLYTDNGVRKSEAIAIEPQVFHALTRYAKRHWGINAEVKP